VVALPVGHRLLELGRALDGADLAGEPMIMYSVAKARYFYDLVVGLIPVAHENVVHSVSQILTMVWLVAAGRGIAVVPASAIRLGIANVVYVPLHTPVREPVELDALWLRDSRNPALREVRNVLKQQLSP
jgi:DNA-binding transcriptional LysR family regulator